MTGFWIPNAYIYVGGICSNKGGLRPPATFPADEVGIWVARGDHVVGPVNGLDAVLIRCIKGYCMVVE